MAFSKMKYTFFIRTGGKKKIRRECFQITAFILSLKHKKNNWEFYKAQIRSLPNSTIKVKVKENKQLEDKEENPEHMA